MDTITYECYKLNKNSEDIIYIFSNEKVIYRKETDENGKTRILEIRRSYEKKGEKQRVLSPHEMPVADFDAWKERLTRDYHEAWLKDKRETRNDVHIEDILDTDLLATESVTDEYIAMNDPETENKRTAAMSAFHALTPVQQSRFYKAKVLGQSQTKIAEEEGVHHSTVAESIEAAEKQLRKMLLKKHN